MIKRILLLFLLATPFLGTASHIVGGEFELVHIKDFQYRLNLVLYFDQKNGNPGAKDLSAVVRIFRMRDDARMMDVTLPLSAESNVDYSQPACSHGELITRKLVYTALITLSPDSFNDAGGYYVAWERCCRNYAITNIFSDDPTRGPNYAGQTFYLEFPAVVKDGQPFVDSTPRLFPPLNDFACPYHPYYTDFGGTDDDGDSLVYSLVAPLNTKTADAVPTGGPRPRPYPDVKWRDPFDLQHILRGAPDLNISTDGFLRVTPPPVQGLFAFAVKVEEYRDKIKIGETRRDFQMLVIDGCPHAVPPQIVGKKLTDAAFTYNNTMNLVFPNTTANADRCIQVQISDPDSENILDNYSENIRIKIVPLNFKKNLSDLLPTVSSATLVHGSTAEFTICFAECPYFIGGAAEIGIVAMDDACTLPLTDTLKISVYVEPPVNHKPVFTSTTPVTATLTEGAQGSWPYQVTDQDNDPLIVSVLTNGFILKDAGMTFTTLHQQNGSADGTLAWDAFCNIYDFTKRNSFQVTVQVEDQDKCLLQEPVKAFYNLNVLLPGNASPTIDTDLTPASRERFVRVTRRLTENISFNVTGKDLTDNDYLVLSGKGADFALSDYKLVIDPVAGNGLVGEPFQWNISCKSMDLKKRDSLDFRFIVVDNANKCRFYKADTVDVLLKVLPPLNIPPQITVTNKNSAATVLNNNGMTMVLGPSIELLVTGTDADLLPEKDNLSLSLIKKTGSVAPSGFVFASATGKSPVQSTFTWQPDCSIFEQEVYENDYTFTFRIDDDHCVTARHDSVTVKIKIKDVDGSDAHFLPPNFFSPNGDNINDYFAMESMDATTGELKNILPSDNCYSQFESIRIYNRWGNSVFDSKERNFKWYGIGESAGVYYYFIKYSRKEYRGSVSLRY